MPLEIEVQVDKRLVITRWTGRLGDAEFVAADAEFRSNPLWKPEYDQLIDLRGATGSPVSRAGVQTITSRPPAFSARSRRAIVVASDLGFGMARMYEQMRGGDAGEIRIFRRIEEAEAWLESARLSDED